MTGDAERYRQAREIINDLVDFQGVSLDDEVQAGLADDIVAALKTEREAAAAEARRAAIEDAAKVCDNIRDEYLTLPRRDPDHDYAAMAGYCAGAIRALASPAPQEETR